MKKFILFFTVFCFFNNSFPNELKYELIVDNLDVPWAFVFLPDDSILITERRGELIHYKNGIKTVIKNLPEIISKNQGGLLDIELHPNYSENKWIYISYSSSNDKNEGTNTSILRFKLNGNQATNQQIIYKALPNSKRSLHYGSRMVFDKDNYIFFSIGDRGNRDLNPQDINRDGGKIYRLHDDGRIPIDNPFVNEKNSKKAIFSYGHRNPQGMFYDEKNNKIWIHEHGPRGGDEINIIEAGENYGWPLASYGINYIGTKFTDKTSIDGMVDPIHFWVPSIAPSGMVYVDNPNYPSLNQSILIGSLKFQYLHQCVIKDGKVVEEKKLFDQIGRVRSVELDNDKNIFVGVENLGIIKLIE
ncbi:MAG: PQQ-dependent sugar dehydrogenase [Flavobacteriaceae bacterium]